MRKVLGDAGDSGKYKILFENRDTEELYVCRKYACTGGRKGLRNTRGRYRRMDRISARTRDNRGSILCSFKGSMERRGETSTPRLGDTLIE